LSPATSTASPRSSCGKKWGRRRASTFACRRRFPRFIAEKGSVCLDGTSLTVNRVAGDVFSVLLIPHTLAVTTWGERRVGDRINLEIDVMARYVARLAEAGSAGGVIAPAA
jgi:riboflavin synthase